ncbi:MAG: hypothetical protein U1F20_09050 [Lysobacterales bacterium]
MNKNANRLYALPAVSILVLGLLAALPAPAFAADPRCLDADGMAIVPEPGTDQGSEGGTDNATCKGTASAYGQQNNASAEYSSAFGYHNTAYGEYGNAFGQYNVAAGFNSNAFGYGNESFGFNGSAFGFMNSALGENSSVFGYRSTASGKDSSVFGRSSEAQGVASSALGYYAKALNIGSTAIGYRAVADRDYAVSVGAAGAEHQIIHLADGTEDFDAVNVRQMKMLANWFGGGASFDHGVFIAPNFTIQGANYNSVAAAFAAVDTKLTALGTGTGTGPAGPRGPAGPPGPAGPQGPAGADGTGGNALAVTYDDAGHASITLAGADGDGGNEGTQVKNVADGTDPMDAVNKRQMDAGDATTLASANAYTDQQFAAWNDSFTQYQQGVERRFAQTDRRIDQVGAMSSAMTHMAVNAANGSGAKGRIAIGVGLQGGEGAVSIGYGKRVGTRGSFTLGAAFGDGENSVGAGFGLDL